MNDRVEKLRRESLDSVPSVSIERAVLLTEFHRDHEVVVDVARIEHRQDVRMLQLRGHLDFVEEFLRPAVDYARDKGLYVIIDFHQIADVDNNTDQECKPTRTLGP